MKQNGIFGDLLQILSDFWSNSKQRVVLNEQNSSSTNFHAEVPQGSILEPLFLTYINDLANDLFSNAKPFADETSLCLVVRNVHTSARESSHDMKKIIKWAFQVKMSFNQDPSKQAQGVIFSLSFQQC